MRDRQTGQVYAGKVIEKARLEKPHSKQKVSLDLAVSSQYSLLYMLSGQKYIN